MPPVPITKVIPTATIMIVQTCVRFTFSVCQFAKFGVKTKLNRLVENQEFRIHSEPAGKQYLLLIAAGKLPNPLERAGTLDSKSLNEFVHDFFLPRFVDYSDAGQLGQQGQGEVFANGHLGHDPLEFPVFGAKSNSRSDCCSGIPRPERATAELHLAGVRLVGPENNAGNLGAAGS